ncbi:TsaA-like domain-containing protein, partial [Pelagophyceae sp. CCMP2097]
PVGWVESPYKERFGTPRQPVVTAVVSGGDEQLGAIVLAQGLGLENSLRDLAGFDYCWVVAHMHLNTGWRPLIQPPRGPSVQPRPPVENSLRRNRKRRRGVFATRAPHRPSQIALSALRIVSVDEKNLRINVKGLDLLDGTPIFDIKPYIPYCDAFPDANAGWVDDLDGA